MFIKNLKAVLMLLVLFVASPAWAEEDLAKIPLALDGYDITSYYSGAALQKGTQEFQASYQGKRYYFANTENRSDFSKNPERYLPEFGEHCAFSASQQMSKKADPTIFTIRNDNLVLFADEQALTSWIADEEKSYSKAQKFWKEQNKYDGNKRLRDESRVRLFSF